MSAELEDRSVGRGAVARQRTATLAAAARAQSLATSVVESFEMLAGKFIGGMPGCKWQDGCIHVPIEDVSA